MQHQKWGAWAVLQLYLFHVGIETPTILCQAIRWSCQSYTLQILASIREKIEMELCLELSLSSFCAVYVAMPSGYKLVITLHSGCMAYIALSPRALVQYMPYIPRACIITIT